MKYLIAYDMTEISSIYWMVIIGIIVFFLCLVLLYLALLLKESKDTVKETKEVLQNSKEALVRTSKVIEDLESTVSIAKSTVEEISTKVLIPFRAISSVIDSLGKRFEERQETEKDSLDELLSE